MISCISIDNLLILFWGFSSFYFEDLPLVPSFHNSHNIFALWGFQLITRTMCSYSLLNWLNYLCLTNWCSFIYIALMRICPVFCSVLRNLPVNHSRQSKAKGDLKTPRTCMARGMRREKGANPIKVRRKILNIVIIHIELK